MSMPAISSSMISQMQHRMFSKADANGDGGISLDEFKNVKGPDGQAIDASKAENLFKKIDADGNGKITEAENNQFLESMPKPDFSKLSFDNSGQGSKLLDILQGSSDEDNGSKVKVDKQDLLKQLLKLFGNNDNKSVTDSLYAQA